MEDGVWICYLLICVLGIIGNLIAIVIILILKEYKKTITHWFILQLAIADALFLTTIPLIVSQYMNGSWYFGESVCKFKEAMLFINYYASIMFLMVMSIDRYFAICHALNPPLQNFRKPAVSVIVTAVVWILAISLSTPIVIYSYQGRENGKCACETIFPPTPLDKCLKNMNGTKAHEICSSLIKNCGNSFPPTPGLNIEPPSSMSPSSAHAYTTTKMYFLGKNQSSNECKGRPDSPGWRGYVWFNFIVMFILPLMIMILCYGLIVKQTWNMKTTTSSMIKDRNRVTITCAILVATFALCWILFHSVHIAKLYGIDFNDQSCRIIQEVSIILPFINSTLNPFLYSFLGPGCLGKCKKISANKTIRRIKMITTSERTTRH